MWSRQAEQREAHEVANNLVYSSIASTHLVSSSVSALGLDPLFPTRGTADGMDPNFDTALAVVDGSVLDSSIGTIRQSKQRRSKSERKTVVQQCTQKSRVDRVHRRAVADCLRNSSTIINGPWPPASFREQFPDIFKNFEIRPSTIPNAGFGLFTKVPLAKGTVIGPYGGTYSSSANRGPYAMEIHTRDGIKYNVDGANRQDPWALLGAINEYTWDLQKNNCALREDGLVVTVRDVSTSPGELFMPYGVEYHWDPVYAGMIRRLPVFLTPLRRLFPIPDDAWEAMSAALREITITSMTDPSRASWLDAAIGALDGSLAEHSLTHSRIPSWSGTWEWWLEQVLRCAPITTMISTRHPNGKEFSCQIDKLRLESQAVQSGTRTSLRALERINYCESSGLDALLTHGALPLPLRMPESSTIDTLERMNSTTHERPVTDLPPRRRRRVLQEEPAQRSDSTPVIYHPDDHDDFQAPDEDSEPVIEQRSANSSTHSSPIRIATWNAGGLTKNEFFINWLFRQKIDICVLVDARRTKEEVKFLRRAIQQAGNGAGAGFLVSCFNPAIHNGHRIGGQIVIVSPRIRHYEAREIASHGCIVQITGAVDDSQFTLFGTYWPLRSPGDTAGSYWHHMSTAFAAAAELSQEEADFIDPITEIKNTLSEAISGARKKSRAVYVLGDFNSDMREGKSDRWDLRRFATDNQLSPLGTMEQLQRVSWINGEGTGNIRCSRVDYILGPEDSLCDCRAVRILQHMQDHKALIGHLPISGGKIERSTKLKLRPNISISDRGRNERLTEALLELHQTMEAAGISAELSDAAYLERISKDTVSLLHSLTRQRRKKHLGISGTIMHSDFDYGRLVAIGHHVDNSNRSPTTSRRAWTPQNFRGQLNKILSGWRNYSSKLTKAGYERDSDASADTPMRFFETCSYEELVCAIGPMITALGKSLRKQVAKDHEVAIRKKILAREEARECGKIGGPIRSLAERSRQSDPYNMEYILLSGVVIREYVRVHATVTGRFKEWFSDPTAITSKHIPAEDWQAWGDEWPLFRDRFSPDNIPDECLRPIHEAFRRKRHDNQEAVGRWQTELLNCPTLTEFKAAIASMSNDSAGGISGFTYNMAKLWPTAIVEKVHRALSALWADNTVPEYWQLAWLVPIPKCENPTLDDLRPLSLIEALRKIWMSITVRRLQDGFQRLRVLDDAQEGSLRGRGTDSAIAKFINILESAKEHSSQIYFSSWDMSKAFDSIPKSLLTYAWVRIGIPATLAQYITELDLGATLVVRTPYATSLTDEQFAAALAGDTGIGFQPERGTGQGDVVSPLAWIAVFDILLTALSTHCDQDQHVVRVRDLDGTLHRLNATGYVDDLITVTAHHESFQEQADIVSAFTVVTGIKLATHKFRAMGINWGPEGYEMHTSVKVHHAGWREEVIPLETDGTVKYLGIRWDMDLSNTTQFQACQQALKDAITRLQRARASAETKWLVLEKCIFEKIAYVARLTPWTLSEYRKLDIIVNGFLRQITKNTRAFPDDLLYAAKPLGMGFTRLSSLIQQRKWSMVERLSQSHVGFAIEGLIGRAATAMASPLSPHRSSVIHLAGGGTTYWATSLIEWLHTIECKITSPGATNPHPAPIHTVATHFTPDLIRELDVHFIEEIYMAGDDTNASFTLPEVAEIPLVVGQKWKLRNPECTATEKEDWQWLIYEIMGFCTYRIDGVLEDHAEVLPWHFPSSGTTCRQAETEDNIPITRGAGSRFLIPCSRLLQSNTMCFLGNESFASQGDQRGITAQLAGTTTRKPYMLPPRQRSVTNIPALQAWLEDAAEIWTDGSWSQVGTLRERLGSVLQTLAGSALVKRTHSGRYAAMRISYNEYVPPDAYTTELLAITAASMYGDAIIHSDCASAIASVKRAQNNSWKSTPMSPLVRALAYMETHRLDKVKAHPERSKAVSDWTEDDKGIYLADCIADPDTRKHREASSLAGKWFDQALTMDECNADDIIEACASRSTFIIRDDKERVVLSDLRRLEAHLVIPAYVEHRDGIRARNGRPVKWRMMARSLALAAWEVRMPGERMTIARRAAVLRSIWDKYMFGDKRREYGEDVLSRCKHCSSSESHSHILRHCEHATIRAYRRRTMDLAAKYIKKFASSPSDYSTFRLLQSLHRLHSHVVRGSDLRWTGLLTQADVESIGETELDQEISDTQFRHLAHLQRIYAGGALAITQAYIHTRDIPPPAGPIQRDIRSYFQPRSQPLAPTSVPSAVTQEKRQSGSADRLERQEVWQVARHTFTSVPSHIVNLTPTRNFFDTLGDSWTPDPTSETEPLTPAAAPPPTITERYTRHSDTEIPPRRRKRGRQVPTEGCSDTDEWPSPTQAQRVDRANMPASSHDSPMSGTCRRFIITESQSPSYILSAQDSEEALTQVPPAALRARRSTRLRLSGAAYRRFLVGGQQAVRRHHLLDDGVLPPTSTDLPLAIRRRRRPQGIG